MKAKQSNPAVQTFLIATLVLTVAVVFVGSLIMRVHSLPFFFASAS